MKTVQLNNGVQMPTLGFGVFQDVVKRLGSITLDI